MITPKELLRKLELFIQANPDLSELGIIFSNGTTLLDDVDGVFSSGEYDGTVVDEYSSVVNVILVE